MPFPVEEFAQMVAADERYMNDAETDVGGTVPAGLRHVCLGTTAGEVIIARSRLPRRQP